MERMSSGKRQGEDRHELINGPLGEGWVEKGRLRGPDTYWERNSGRGHSEPKGTEGRSLPGAGGPGLSVSSQGSAVLAVRTKTLL